jgi:hypothetical protein
LLFDGYLTKKNRMNNQELKTIWKLARTLFITAFIIWFSETSIFLLIEGWHLKATNPIEMFLDKVVENVLHTAIFITCYFAISSAVNLVRSSD